VTKIYEALEHARREKHPMREPVEKAVEKPGERSVERLPEPHPVATKVASVAPSLREPNLEREMTALYQSIESLLPSVSHKVIQLISSRPREGTSTIIRELARAITAVMGRSVLLLDIDRRHPHSGALCDIAPSLKLDDVLEGKASIEETICQIDGTILYVSSLFQHSVLTPQKLESESIDHLWDQLRQRFDYVLIDSPPITISSDGLAIVRKVDGVIFVIEAEKTRWPVALAAKEKIVSHGGNILGMVFNKRRYYIPDFVYRKM
jgi:protein-tyrosine kinase